MPTTSKMMAQGQGGVSCLYVHFIFFLVVYISLLFLEITYIYIYLYMFIIHVCSLYSRIYSYVLIFFSLIQLACLSFFLHSVYTYIYIFIILSGSIYRFSGSEKTEGQRKAEDSNSNERKRKFNYDLAETRFAREYIKVCAFLCIYIYLYI